MNMHTWKDNVVIVSCRNNKWKCRMALLNGTLSCPMIADNVGIVWITFTIISFPVYMSTLLHKYTSVVHIQISKSHTWICFMQIKKKTRSFYANIIWKFDFVFIYCYVVLIINKMGNKTKVNLWSPTSFWKSMSLLGWGSWWESWPMFRLIRA